jgi:hypothetical protein
MSPSGGPRTCSDARLFSISSLITKSPEIALRRPFVLEAVFVGQTYFHDPIFTHNLRTSQFPPIIPMSASNQTTGPSTDNFTAIFNAASIEYQTLTGKSLITHPFAAQLDACQNPDAISNLLRAQAQAFGKFREEDERLMAWLDPTIHILFTFSATLGEGIGLVSNLVSLHKDCSQTSGSQPFSPAKTIFAAIGVLLGVCLSQFLVTICA